MSDLRTTITEDRVAGWPLDDGLDALLDGLLATPEGRALEPRRGSRRPARRWPVAAAAAAAVATAIVVPTLLLAGGAPRGLPSATTTTSPQQDPSSPDSPKASDGAAGSVSVLPPGDRGAPIELSGTTLDGEPFDLADLRGQEVVVHVWASWCAPCRDDLELLAEDASDLDAPVVGVVLEDLRATALAAERELGGDYPSLFLGDTPIDGVPGLGDLAGLPVTFVLDEQGRVAAEVTGRLLPGIEVLRSLVDVPRLPTLPDTPAEPGD